MFGRKPKSDDPFGQGADPDAVEWEAVREARKAHHANGFAILLVMVIVVSLLGLALGWKASQNASVMLDAVSRKMNSVSDVSPGREAAEESVYEWLAGQSTPVPDGFENLSWVSASRTMTAKDGTQSWVHVFTFIQASDGRTRRCSQLVTVKDGVASVPGAPTLFALGVEDSQSAGSVTPEGYRSLDSSGNLEGVVREWAKAWTGSDSNALTVLVGDPDSSHAYQPANLGAFKQASVDWSVWCDSTGGVADRDSGWALVEATVMFQPSRVRNPVYGASASSSASSVQSQQASTTVTLLVRDPSGGNAKVVDWGSAGVLSGLREYGQAVSADAVSSGASSTSESSASTEPTEQAGE